MAVGAFALATWTPSIAQTYKVNSEAPEQPIQAQPQVQTSQQPGKSLGWGSNIENARLARAAGSALKAGKYAEAVDYAQRSGRSCSQRRSTLVPAWILGTTLAGKSPLSVDAFNHGLRVNPTSLDGLSGLAQTYSRMGRRTEARKLLERVLAADSRRSNDLLLLGEMTLQSGDYAEALVLTQSANSSNPVPGQNCFSLLLTSASSNSRSPALSRSRQAASLEQPWGSSVTRCCETGDYSAAIAALKAIPGGPDESRAGLRLSTRRQARRSHKLYVEAADAAPRDCRYR